MLLTVRVPGWELESDRRVLSVGETLSTWLTFHEDGESSIHAEGVQVVHGVARSLSDWPGRMVERHPVQIDLDGGSLYWDAPAPVAGPLEVVGTVRTNNVDAPDDFPITTGVVSSLRMEWSDYVKDSDDDALWHPAERGARYDEVSATYFPPVEKVPLDREGKADLRRRAKAIYDREVSLGRVTRGRPFTVSLFGGGMARPVPPGATRTEWTGVLVDLEIGGRVASED